MQPEIVKGTYVDLLVGDGAGTEVFTPFCGLTTRSFTAQVNTSDIFVPDCANPEDIPTRRLNVTGRQWDLSGEGLFNLGQEAIVRASLGATKNYRFRIARPAGSTTGTGYYQGPAMVTNLTLGGSAGGEFAPLSMAIASDGIWTWTPAAGA